MEGISEIKVIKIFKSQSLKKIGFFIELEKILQKIKVIFMTTKDQELKILHQIIGTISYNLDLKEVLSRIINLVGELTKADSCFLYLLDGKDLVLRASQNQHPGIIGKVRLKIGEGITGWVAKIKQQWLFQKKLTKMNVLKFLIICPKTNTKLFYLYP